MLERQFRDIHVAVLALEQSELPVIRRIFDLALGRNGVHLGVKAIVNQMNSQGHRFRGKLFHVACLHRLLTSKTYAGTHYFNQWDTKRAPKGQKRS